MALRKCSWQLLFFLESRPKRFQFHFSFVLDKYVLRKTKNMPRRSGRLQMQRQDQLFVAQKHARKVRILNRKRKLSPEDCQEMSKEMFQFEIQNRWIPVSETVGFNRSALIPTPENGPSSPIDKPIDSFSSFRFKNIFPCPIKDRTSPLPDLNWADSSELWRNMLKREIHYVRDRSCLERHPLIDAKMRSILLDWLIEVCEVYHLHRETFFLAQDYVDRFLAASKDIPKMTLQLIGITSLFIASKLEEIYPPKLGDFAYVTDGACSERNILDQEIIMLQALKWNLSPVTVNNWLNVYMQLAHTDEIIEGEANFLFPKYSPTTFIQITQEQEKQVVLKKFRNVVVDDSHNIQTHSENLELLQWSVDVYRDAPDIRSGQTIRPDSEQLSGSGSSRIFFQNPAGSFSKSGLNYSLKRQKHKTKLN
ncbi:cyclin E [Apostichopus japonicus]|uniref:Cyclin E n=1 Tax=Stichopus japonicus TaxID=307972 RepID=A0A2G8L164_STIJA|nr:cyclin E [Apostichopus japonicus]